MELNQLETFLAVAEERSFSRAAVRLHRTQPAVSQVIRESGARHEPEHRPTAPECEARCRPHGWAVVRFNTNEEDRFLLFLLAACAVVGRAQESRQDISMSGIGLI